MSILDILEPVYKLLPEVQVPEVPPTIKKKLIWTSIALVLFYIMGNINAIGVIGSNAGPLEQLQVLLASNIGSIITVGIGPIVLSSIILQLLVGGGLLNIDLTVPKDKSRFTAMQKLFAIILCVVESAVYVVSGLVIAAPGMQSFVILQIALGSIALLYLDEIVSKHGIGSGIGIFIAAGVSGAVFWRIFNPTFLNPATGQVLFDIANAEGLIFLFVREFGTNAWFAFVSFLTPILFAILVFLVVVFAEGIHVNIPVAVGRAGYKSRFPVKFLYVSNIPVILAVALFANVQLLSSVLQGPLNAIPLAGNYLNGALTFFASVVIAPQNLAQNLLIQGISPLILQQFIDSILRLQFIGLGGSILHGIFYISILTLVAVVFGKFWVEMAGQGPEAVSKQLTKSGMFIPGFRRDPRIIRQILDRYIPPISILGSAFVGLLAGFADLTGALGSGTGILLTVGIVYRLYEELAKAQVLEMHPLLGKLLG